MAPGVSNPRFSSKKLVDALRGDANGAVCETLPIAPCQEGAAEQEQGRSQEERQSARDTGREGRFDEATSGAYTRRHGAQERARGTGDCGVHLEEESRTESAARSRGAGPHRAASTARHGWHNGCACCRARGPYGHACAWDRQRPPAHTLSLARRRKHRYVAAGFPVLQEIAMVRTGLLGGAS